MNLIQDSLNIDTLVASLLIIITGLCLMAFFYHWINIVLAIVFGVGTYGYIKNMIKTKETKQAKIIKED